MEVIVCRGAEDHLSKTLTKLRNKTIIWTYKVGRLKARKEKEL